MAADNSGGQWQQMRMACKIGWRTTMGKVVSGRKITMALSIRDGEDDVVFDGGHMVQFYLEEP